MSQSRKHKGLKGAEIPLKLLISSIERLQLGNNNTNCLASLTLYVGVSILRLHSIRFSDLQIQEFKPFAEKNCRVYCLILISLHIEGNQAVYKLLKDIGVWPAKALKLVDQLKDAGYIEQVIGKTKQSMPLGRHFYKETIMLQLTSKGIDKVNHLYSLLIDQRLINPDL